MKILLTGAGSFLGRHLLPLLQKPHEIYCLVRRPAGLANEIGWDFNSPLPAQIPDCEAVIHLAAFVNFEPTMRLEQYEINTLSTLRLAQYAQKHNAYFVFSSMAGIHAPGARIGPSSPIAPANHYGMSKYLAEEIIKACVARYALLRIGGMYGINGPAHLGLNTAITEAFLHQTPPTLKGPGKARRNYICVLDAAKWIACLIDGAEKGRAGQDIVYVAGEQILSIEGYLSTVAEVLAGARHLHRIEGAESSDCIIEGSPSPFQQTAFKNYLGSLKHEAVRF